jgi:hypothetical protein
MGEVEYHRCTVEKNAVKNAKVGSFFGIEVVVALQSHEKRTGPSHPTIDIRNERGLVL